ncbi:metallophosphoesterase [Hyalangium gracile]|uniref:metallophosphoesterase n=1 Tax=Hyalangium gracile TaxID=394092 RepID=UPI001CC9DF5E|nr:metallophosphoesterase [Hyalangium gracile]
MRGTALPRLSFGLALMIGLVSSVDGAWAATKSSAWTVSGGPFFWLNNPRFTLTLSQTALVTVDLESPSVDPFLWVLDAAGGVILGNDNDSGDGTNSRLTLLLGPGKYQVVAATAGFDQTGDFTLRTSHGSLSYCFTAFTDSNYAGTASIFCGGTGSFLNDEYSSFRIPKGMRLRAFEHSDRTGLSRTYYQDVPSLGGLFNDKISAFSWGDLSTNDFYMLFASDPQFSWKLCDDYDVPAQLCAQETHMFGSMSEEELARYYNSNLVIALNAVKAHLGDSKVAGVVVNGDLTETGDKDTDLGDYVSIYERGLDMNLYAGLGNHDYDNYVDDCSENHCNSTMVWHLKEQVRTYGTFLFDYSESDDYYEFPSYRRDHSGSLAYSWDVGDVHFVQLNNHPSYARTWDGWNFSEARRDYFTIRSALSWLRFDLTLATSRGKKIILNLHDFDTDAGNAEFKDILAAYPVSAIYSGHEHSHFGRIQELGPYAGGKMLPVFRSGAAHYGTFMVARFLNGKMYVWLMSVDQFNQGRKLRVHYNGALHDATNLDAIFNVSGTRYYQYVYDMR